MSWFGRKPPPLPSLTDNRTRHLVEEISEQVLLLREATEELRAVIKRMNVTTGKATDEHRPA